MELPIYTYYFIILYGSIHYILFSIISIFDKRFRVKCIISIELMFFSFGLAGIVKFFNIVNLDKDYFVLRYLPIYYPLLIPLGIYYFVTYLLNPEYQFGRKDYWFSFPFFISIAGNFLLFFLFLIHPSIIEYNIDEIRSYFRLSLEVTAIIYCLIVIPLVFNKIRIFKITNLDGSLKFKKEDIKWLKNLLFLSGPLLLVLVIHNYQVIINGEFSLPLYSIFWILLIILVYGAGYILVVKRDIFTTHNIEQKLIIKNQENQLLSTKTNKHYLNILKLMEEEKLYQNNNLNLNLLSERTKLSGGYISRIIKEKEGKNFYDFINTFRIEEVKKNLNNEDYLHYSILGIGLEAGFKSKSTFYAVFKKMTGVTPAAYRKSLK